MKTLILLGLLLGMVLPFQQPCATITLTLDQAQVQHGGTQSITSDVTNCGEKKTKLGVTVTVTDSVGHISLIRNSFHNLNPSQSIILPDSYPVAIDAPLGTYRVMTLVFVTVNGNTTEIARDEQTFEVVP